MIGNDQEGLPLLFKVGYLFWHTEKQRRTVVQRMMKNRAGQNESIEKRDIHADFMSFTHFPEKPGGRGSVQ